MRKGKNFKSFCSFKKSIIIYSHHFRLQNPPKPAKRTSKSSKISSNLPSTTPKLPRYTNLLTRTLLYAPRNICDFCGFSTSSKLKLTLHMRNNHIQLPILKKRSIPQNKDDRICLVCGQTLDRKGSLIQHYLKIHGQLLELKSKSDFDINSIKSKLKVLKKAGKWSEPKKIIPVKRTNKYKHLEEIESNSDEDTDEYYKNYEGPYGIEMLYHSSSDEYEELCEDFKCEKCGRIYTSQISLNNHRRKCGKKIKKEKPEENENFEDELKVENDWGDDD